VRIYLWKNISGEKKTNRKSIKIQKKKRILERHRRTKKRIPPTP